MHSLTYKVNATDSLAVSDKIITKRGNARRSETADLMIAHIIHTANNKEWTLGREDDPTSNRIFMSSHHFKDSIKNGPSHDTSIYRKNLGLIRQSGVMDIESGWHMTFRVGKGRITHRGYWITIPESLLQCKDYYNGKALVEMTESRKDSISSKRVFDICQHQIEHKRVNFIRAENASRNANIRDDAQSIYKKSILTENTYLITYTLPPFTAVKAVGVENHEEEIMAFDPTLPRTLPKYAAATTEDGISILRLGGIHASSIHEHDRNLLIEQVADKYRVPMDKALQKVTQVIQWNASQQRVALAKDWIGIVLTGIELSVKKYGFSLPGWSKTAGSKASSGYSSAESSAERVKWMDQQKRQRDEESSRIAMERKKDEEERSPEERFCSAKMMECIRNGKMNDSYIWLDRMKAAENSRKTGANMPSIDEIIVDATTLAETSSDSLESLKNGQATNSFMNEPKTLSTSLLNILTKPDPEPWEMF